MSDIYANRIEAARTIGAGEVKAERLAAEILAGLPLEFDPKARGAITGAIHAYLTGTTDSDAWPAVARGPKGEQTRTNYGRGVDAIARNMRKSFESGPKETALRATLSGEGGGSVKIDPDTHPELYSQLVALITTNAGE